VGMLLIFLYSSLMPPQKVSLLMLAFQPENQPVVFSGKVTEIEPSAETTTFRLCDGGECVSVVLEKKTAAPYLLCLGRTLVVQGRVETYREHVFVRGEKLSYE